MLNSYKIFIYAALAMLIGVQAVSGQAIDVAEKAVLQAAMQQHIDRNLVNGAYLNLDLDAGIVQSLRPAKAHTMILKMGDHVVLYSDFRDSQGNLVNIDFYLVRRDRSYVVFHSAVDDRNKLRHLMKIGKVRQLE